MLEKDEEISELKAERNNTRLLLEHLECLVSRHERSLRMTVVKRQTASQSGVSSEVEVLKALKSLFEHHKALDEKVRERLRVALEKNTSLEEECSGVRDELSRYKLGLIDAEAQKVSTVSHEPSPYSNGENGEKKMNGGVELPLEVLELRKQVEKHSNDLGNATRTITELRTKVTELENKLISNNKELHAAQDLNQALQHEYKETMAQKEDQEERIATLEKRYLNSQREATQLHDLNERIDQEIKNKEEQISLYQEKIKATNEKLDISEQKLIEYASMPDIEEQLKDRMEALAAAQERQGTAEEHCAMVGCSAAHCDPESDKTYFCMTSPNPSVNTASIIVPAHSRKRCTRGLKEENTQSDIISPIGYFKSPIGDILSNLLLMICSLTRHYQTHISPILHWGFEIPNWE